MEYYIVKLGQTIVQFSNWIWGIPLLILLLGGGIFFVFYSRFLPFQYFGHAIAVLRGKYDDPDDPGQINHFQALSTALAATVGMGNISGVAIAIATGGPGAIFWMWVSAFFGIATKFFTCTLAVMYRGKDTEGHLQGGPMYVIMEGLGRSWKPMAVFFSLFGLIGVLPIFQANQLTQVIRDVTLKPNEESIAEFLPHIEGMTLWTQTNIVTGLLITVLVGVVIFGGLKRIASVAAKMVPAMVILYFVAVLYIILANSHQLADALSLIVTDAFTGDAVLGGALGAVIIAGARRAAFSNEAGIGTAPMAHGDAKTDEPIREGLVGMMGPVIDTLIVCTLTALAILVTGVWQNTSATGVTMTVKAFETGMPGFGAYVLAFCIAIFAITSLFSYSHYGTKCTSFLLGAKYKNSYNYLYVSTIIIGAVASLSTIISVIDSAFALMSIPTMISTLLLAPKVMSAAKSYFSDLKNH